MRDFMHPKFLLTAILAAATTQATAATLTVGPGQAYPSIAQAVAASQNGDTLAVQSGTYVNDFAEINTQISLLAIGGRVTLRATEMLPNEKGIFIVNATTSITGFDFSGAQIAASLGGNGAGIRHQDGNLTLTDCWFHDNQEGILSTPASSGDTLSIINSEFNHNGVASGPVSGYEHNIYAGNLDVLDIEGSYIHDALVGHEVKSRALTTVINNSRIADGPHSTSSYSVDLPNGGNVSITNTQIEQGPKGENSNIIAYGEEGNLLPNSALSLQNMLIENDETYATPRAILNATAITPAVSELTLWGMTTDDISNAPLSLGAVSLASTEPVISKAHPWPN